jgi:hypothetical protein
MHTFPTVGTYEECAAHDHQDATLRIAWLRVDCRDLMLDFLEGETLLLLSALLVIV